MILHLSLQAPSHHRSADWGDTVLGAVPGQQVRRGSSCCHTVCGAGQDIHGHPHAVRQPGPAQRCGQNGEVFVRLWIVWKSPTADNTQRTKTEWFKKKILAQRCGQNGEVFVRLWIVWKRGDSWQCCKLSEREVTTPKGQTEWSKIFLDKAHFT